MGFTSLFIQSPPATGICSTGPCLPWELYKAVYSHVLLKPSPSVNSLNSWWLKLTPIVDPHPVDPCLTSSQHLISKSLSKLRVVRH